MKAKRHSPSSRRAIARRAARSTVSRVERGLSARGARLPAKMLRDINDRMVRMYEAAVTNNLNADFPVSVTSANAEILVSFMASRTRARKLERDNPYAFAIIETFQNNIGGDDPFRLEMKVGKRDASGEFVEETDTNREIEEAWHDAGMPENCTVRRDISRLEMDLMTISAMVRDGGIIHRHHRFFPNNKFAYALEPIEVDRLDYQWARPAVGTDNEIQFSIEMDQWHAPVAYWILTRHPGDVFAWSNSSRYRERVDARDIIALFDIRTRAGQYVGMPRFSSIIQRLHRLDQFDIAHVTAAIWASCKPWFITQTSPTAEEYTGDAETEEGEKIQGVSPGEGEILPRGYEPKLVDPKFPIEAAAEFMKSQLRGASAGSGTAYHIIGNDLEGVNFSSGRLGQQQFHDTCRKLQRHIILNYRRPHFNEWLKYAILSRIVKQPISRLEELQRAARFHGRRWPYINPLQDAQADILRIEAGLTSRSQVIADSGRGGDVEQVDAEIAADRKVDEAHDLDFSGADPTKPGLKTGEPGQELPNAENQPEAGGTGGKPPAKKGGKQTIKANGNGHARFATNGH